ncbi:hypothetical protein ACIRTB_35565 [Streptomyces sp. NPDC101158]|uniref:hypothetical protein n=1 Tax=Streptomyces sp. NPDC101158 TaxID=3366117 RepID=UPI003810912B
MDREGLADAAKPELPVDYPDAPAESDRIQLKGVPANCSELDALTERALLRTHADLKRVSKMRVAAGVA